MNTTATPLTNEAALLKIGATTTTPTTPNAAACTPQGADSGPQAPRPARSMRWAAGLSSVLVSVMFFSTVADLFQGANPEGRVAMGWSSTDRG